MVVDLCIGQSCPSSFEQAKVTPPQRALTAFLLDCAGFLDTCMRNTRNPGTTSRTSLILSVSRAGILLGTPLHPNVLNHFYPASA